MKRKRAIALLLVLGACAFLVYRALVSRRAGPSQTIATQCDQSLWEYVYNPDRLRVLDPCISVTGTVEKVTKEVDGDYHVRFRLDQEFVSLLDEKNISEQHGGLVLELICQGKVRQADAVDPCNRYDGPHFEPEIGQRYLVWGTYVHDADHGWNELHPVSFMQPIPTISE